MEQIEELFKKLNDNNKDVINLLAKGMLVAQESERKG